MDTRKEKPSRPAPLNIQEIGAPIDGEPQVSNRRLFFQLHVFGHCHLSNLSKELERIDCRNKEGLRESKGRNLDVVVYEDLNRPAGVGILLIAEDPTNLITKGHNVFAFGDYLASYRPEMTMIGRTYATGREPNLEQWLINKPRQNALNPRFPWAIWYPLRRKTEFYRLEPRERGRILAEHAMLGRSYAAGGYASDIRLACFGLDANDNEFVIGLVGPELYPLSRLIQDMRQTEQTTKYIESLGPFFVGRVRGQFRSLIS